MSSFMPLSEKTIKKAWLLDLNLGVVLIILGFHTSAIYLTYAGVACLFMAILNPYPLIFNAIKKRAIRRRER